MTEPLAQDEAGRAPGPASPWMAQPLIDWYADNARDLPWRRPGFGAWGVLVSEFMLQQTPVNRVIPHLQAWLERWPTPAALAVEPPSEAVRQWANLGYPRRALRLHSAAVEISERHSGVVPSDVQALLALSGSGHSGRHVHTRSSCRSRGHRSSSSSG